MRQGFSVWFSEGPPGFERRAHPVCRDQTLGVGYFPDQDAVVRRLDPQARGEARRGHDVKRTVLTGDRGERRGAVIGLGGNQTSRNGFAIAADYFAQQVPALTFDIGYPYVQIIGEGGLHLGRRFWSRGGRELYRFFSVRRRFWRGIGSFPVKNRGKHCDQQKKKKSHNILQIDNPGWKSLASAMNELILTQEQRDRGLVRPNFCSEPYSGRKAGPREASQARIADSFVLSCAPGPFVSPVEKCYTRLFPIRLL